jgi:hypothetical protein
MAVDTRSRRASVLGVGLTAALTMPLADASVDQPDRQHVALCYAGISASNTVQFSAASRIGLRWGSGRRGLRMEV